MITPQESKLRGSSVKRQFQVFTALSIGIAVWAQLGYLLNKNMFRNYFGEVYPLLVILLLSFLGILMMGFLFARGYFTVFSKTSARARSLGFVLAAGLASMAILVDVMVKFPADMNLLFPESVFFYPAIGFCVEIVFHILPLSILLWTFTGLFRQTDSVKILWLSIFIVAFIEPIFQVVSGFSAEPPAWVSFWVGFHVFLINLTQLLIFKSYGFVWMYLFRLVYYFFWHVAWGYFRLQMLY